MYFKKYNHDFIFFIKIVYKIKRYFSFKNPNKEFLYKKIRNVIQQSGMSIKNQ